METSTCRPQRPHDIDLQMWGNPDHSVLLIYSKWGGGHKQTFSSKGDLSRLRDLVRSTHDTPLPMVYSSVREGLESREGVHRDRRLASEQHRVDCKPRSSTKYIS